jgi:hypothetical protein
LWFDDTQLRKRCAIVIINGGDRTRSRDSHGLAPWASLAHDEQ